MTTPREHNGAVTFVQLDDHVWTRAHRTKNSIGVGQQGRGNRLRLNQTERWTRKCSWSADKMELVYFPPTEELRCWWRTMS